MAHALVLGGMVGNATGLNPDGLSLDLQFAVDKTLTARKGPTPVFTRLSSSTYFGPLMQMEGKILITTGIANGRATWAIAGGIILHALSYDGTRWVAGVDVGDYQESYYAALGSEWTPDKANWTNSGIPSTLIPIESDADFGVLLATTNQPRFDCNTSTLDCKGLLIEEPRTNQIKYSYNNFTNAYWNSTVNNVTAVDSVVSGPNGIADGASSLTEIAGVAVTRHIHEATGVFIPAANTAYTMSVWVKQSATDSVRYVQLAFWIAGFGSTAYMNYDLQNGVVGTGGAGITAKSITSYPNGWYRITATATSVASPGASGFQLGFSTTSGAVRTEAYTVVSPLKSIYVWGAQLEAGSFPASYIPTTTGTAVRSADVCSISDISSFYNSLESTVFTEALVGSASNFCSVVGFDNSSNSNQMTISAFPSPNTLNNYVVTSGSTQSQVQLSFSTNSFFKAAISNKLNSFQLSLNGVNGTKDTSGTMPTVSRFVIGASWSNAPINGHIKSIKVYQKALTDSKLLTLTA